GTVIKNAGGTWSWSFATTDGPDDSQTVTITATNADLSVSTTSFALTVNNVAPQNVAIVGMPAANTIGEQNAVNLSSSFTDPGADTHTFLWSVMTGNGDVIPGGTSSNFSFTPDAPGTYQIHLTVTDSDGAAGTAMETLTVTHVTFRVIDFTPTASGFD